MSVYNDNNESIGSINELLMDKSGSIKGVRNGLRRASTKLTSVASFDKVSDAVNE